VFGKLARCAAMAMTFGSYALPSVARPLAVGAVLALTALNYFGVQKSVTLTRLIVAAVLAALAVAIAAIWLGGDAEPDRLWPITGASVYGVLQAAGFLLFAFARYARLATLGEEVVDPARTIPRAIPIALAFTLLVYGAVAISALAGPLRFSARFAWPDQRLCRRTWRYRRARPAHRSHPGPRTSRPRSRSAPAA
jgi:APA family basic amino acid/polyamine antiporter